MECIDTCPAILYAEGQIHVPDEFREQWPSRTMYVTPRYSHDQGYLLCLPDHRDVQALCEESEAKLEKQYAAAGVDRFWTGYFASKDITKYEKFSKIRINDRGNVELSDLCNMLKMELPLVWIRIKAPSRIRGIELWQKSKLDEANRRTCKEPLVTQALWRARTKRF